MDKIIEYIEKEFIDELSKLPPQLTHPSQIRVLADISAIYSALEHYKMEHKDGHVETGWKDDIADELRSAKEKYEAFLKSNDTTMLEMARQELNHANYYINHAKMSPDMELRKKVPMYQKEYDQLALKLNAPHGSEKLGRL